MDERGRRTPLNGDHDEGPGLGQMEAKAPVRTGGVWRKILIAFAVFGLSVVLLGTAGFLVAWYRFNDEALAKYLTKGWNRKHRGNLVLGKVQWTPSAVWDLFTGSDHRLVVTDIRIYDSRGQLVIYVPKAVGKGKLWPVIRHGDFDLREARAKEALVVLERFRRPDGPDEQGKKFELGLVGAFEKNRKRRKKKKRKKKHRSLIRVDFLKIDKVRFEMRYPGISVVLRDALLQGSITSLGKTRTKKTKVLFDAKAQVPKGVVRYKDRELAVRDLEITRACTLPETPKDLYFKIKRATIEKAKLAAEARLIHLYGGRPKGLDASVSLTNLGPLLTKMSNGIVYGEEARLEASASGPYSDLDANATVSGIHARYKGYGARNLNAKLALRDEKATLKQATVDLLRGQLALRGQFELESFLWSAQANLKNIHTVDLMKKEKSKRQWGGVLDGEIVASGRAPRPHVDLKKLKLTYALNKPLKGVGRILHAKGRLQMRGSRVTVEELDLEAGHFTLASRGRVQTKNGRVALAVSASGRKLRKLLRKMKAPGVADSVALDGRVSGKMKNPYFKGTLNVQGLGHRRGSSGRLKSSVEFASGTLGLSKIRAYAYRGGASGRARVSFYGGSFKRMYRQPQVRADLRFDGLSLRSLTRKQMLKGRLNGGVRVRGPAKRLRGRVWVKAPNLRVKKQRYENGQVEVSLKRGDYLLDFAGIQHTDGGRLRAWGAYRRGGGVQLTAQLERLPLSGIPGLSKIAPKTIGGKLTGNLSLSGSQSWPILAGTLSLLRAKVRGIFMGTTKIKIEPEADKSLISGRLFHHFRLSGQIRLKPSPAVELEVVFTKFPLQKLVPEITEVANAHGHVSGKLKVKVNTNGVQSAVASLDEIRVTMLQESLDPLLPPEEFHLYNKKPIVLAYDGHRLKIRRFHMTGAAGDFHIKGWASMNDSDIRLRGTVGLKPLELFTGDQLDEITGSVLANLRMWGPPKRPRVRGSLQISDVAVLLPNREAKVKIPTGLVQIRDRRKGFEKLAVALRRLKIQMGEESLRADGTLDLRKGKPQKFALRLSGYLSGEALKIASPKMVTHARGKTKVDLRISGTPQDQSIWGTAELGRTDLSLRGIRRDISIQSGELTFDGRRLNVTRLRARVDEGYVSAKGYAIFKGMKFSEVDLKVMGQNIPFRKSRVFEVEMGANVRVTGGQDGFTLSGQIDVVDGRYIQKFAVVRRAFLKKRVSESSAGSWKDNPALANLSLNLSVTTSGNIFIQNNIADMRLDGNIYVGGTLANPQLGGQVQVDEGRFRIPFMRGSYDVQRGEIDFNRGEEAFINLAGETTVRDRTDTEHLITLSLTGFISEIRINFTSDTSLPKSQILLLLASGRTTDSLRQQFQGNKDAGAGTGRSGSALDVYDPMLKQVSGDFLSDLVAKPIKNITKLDLFRLELGTSAVQLRMEKRLGRYFKLVGETEFGLMGRQRQEGRLEGKFHDNVYVDVKGRRLIPGEDVFEEEDPLQGRIQLRYRLRFKGGLVRSLGF